MNDSNKNIRIVLASIKSCFLLTIPIFIIIFVLLMSGCSIPGMQISDTSQNEATSDAGVKESAAEKEPTETDTTKPDKDVDDTATKNTEENTETTEQEETTEEAGGEEIKINVYYCNETAEYLIPETRIVPEDNKYAEAIYEMMMEPTDSTLVRLIPETTKINSIVVEDGLAKIDLSSNFVDDRFVSDVVDILLTYSVVNTLTEFDEISSVEFYIDGQKLDLIGMLDISDPLFRRTDLIKQE